MRVPVRNSVRRSGTKVIELSDYARTHRVSKHQMMQEFAMDPGYQMPDRLALQGEATLSDAQSDAQDVTKRAIRSFVRFVAMPENIPMFLNALDGRKALDRPMGAHDKMMQLAKLLRPDTAETGATHIVAIAKSVPLERVLQTQAINTFPEPVAMAYVETGHAADSVVFSQNLGFRDMQLHAQYAGPMHALTLARKIGLDLDEPATLTRLHSIQSQKMDGTSILPKQAVKIVHSREIHSIPPTRFTLDPRLTA